VLLVVKLWEKLKREGKHYRLIIWDGGGLVGRGFNLLILVIIINSINKEGILFPPFPPTGLLYSRTPR
jgi:hypothetical protein|tara:strand:+ start:160 stop:363 length:204 start_codon:yes stop_codon:yes gene_type:complete